MAKNDNLTDFLTDIADAIRNIEGSTEPISPQDMAMRIASLGNETIDAEERTTIEDILTDIANAIRLVEGSTELINPQDMSEIISSFNIDYSTWRGVFIQDINGRLYQINKWDSTKTANGVAIQTDNASFVLALTDASPSYCTWGTRSNIAGVNNSDSKATVKTYFNGEIETDSIIANAASSIAASYCKNYIFPNGQQGYMGAGGEWWTVLSYKNDIITAMEACGGTTPSKDYWCTTEQVGSNRAWAADWEGADLTNYNKSSSSSVKARAFQKIIY